MCGLYKIHVAPVDFKTAHILLSEGMTCRKEKGGGDQKSDHRRQATAHTESCFHRIHLNSYSVSSGEHRDRDSSTITAV